MRFVWNREAVWSERDTCRRRRHSLGRSALFAMMAVGLVTANHACYELLFLTEEPRAKPQFFAPTITDDCTVDADCVLMPSITCCGECSPTPPFTAVTHLELADLRSGCFPREQLCEPPICSRTPDGCEARAVCRAGECKVVSNDRCLDW